MKLFWMGLVLVLGLVVVAFVIFSDRKSIVFDNQAGGSDYEVIEIQGGLPDGFPLLPVFPQASIVSSVKSLEGSRMVYSAKFEAEAGVVEVAQWYLDQMQNEGWEVVSRPLQISPIGEQEFVFSKNGLETDIVFELEGVVTDVMVSFPAQDLKLYETL